MDPTRARRRGRLAALSLLGTIVFACMGTVPAAAQIAGIERGGGVDRPYVPPRKRLNIERTTVRAKPPKDSPKGTKPVVDAASMPISSDAIKHYDAGRALYDKGNIDGAIKEYEAAIRIESKFVDALIDLGDAYFDKVDLEDAADVYQRALVVDKNNSDAQFRLGRASYARRDYDTALEQYNDVLKVRPDDPEAIYNIALTYKALKRYDDAIPYFEKAIKARNRPFPEARINVARCYYEQGNLEKSEAAARKALEETGPDTEDSSNAWYALATALAKKPDLIGASDALEHAIAVCQKCPGDMVSRFFLALAQVLESRGQLTRAADNYERFLQLAPFVPDYQKDEIRERISRLRKTA